MALVDHPLKEANQCFVKFLHVTVYVSVQSGVVRNKRTSGDKQNCIGNVLLQDGPDHGFVNRSQCFDDVSAPVLLLRNPDTGTCVLYCSPGSCMCPAVVSYEMGSNGRFFLIYSYLGQAQLSR